MAKSAGASANSEAFFDLERLREVIELMEKHGLTEVSLRQGDQTWRLRRGPQEAMQMPPAGAIPVQAAPVADSASPSEPGSQSKTDDFLTITSPTVGTFYAAASPDDPPFVSVGAKIQPDTIVCIVEAMKVFNQIPAEVSGTIVEILIGNGDSVEFGQPLYRVRPG
jgi:acetyl-CoA carboxylase biotin carboxyl carrier protein